MNSTLMENILQAAHDCAPEHVCRVLGMLREIESTLLARLSAPAPAQQPDELLTCAQAAERLQCSRDYLYKTDLPFKRKLGRKLLFSNVEITEFLAKQK